MTTKNMDRSELYITIIGGILLFNGLLLMTLTLVTGFKNSPTAVASYIMGIVGGLVAIVRFRKAKIYGVAFCLLIMGAASILADINTILNPTGFSSTIEALLYVVSGVVLTYYALTLAIGLRTGSAKGILCLGVLAVLELLSFLMVAHRGDTLTEGEWAELLMAIEHGVIIFILTRPEMMIPPFLKRLKANSDLLYDSLSTDSSVSIDRDEAGLLTDVGDGEGWTHFENGPIERERTIRLHGHWVATEIVIQKWRGDDRPHLTVRSRDADSYGIYLSMIVESSVPITDEAGKLVKVRLYGQEGVFAEIRTTKYEEIDKGYVGTVKTFIAKRVAKQKGVS